MDPTAPSLLSSLPASCLASLHPSFPPSLESLPVMGSHSATAFAASVLDSRGEAARRAGWETWRELCEQKTSLVWSHQCPCEALPFPPPYVFLALCLLTMHKCVFSLALFPVFSFSEGNLGSAFSSTAFTQGRLEQSKMKRRPGGGLGAGVQGGTPCFIHPSKWEDTAAFMPVRGGGNLVKEWKEGASLNHTPADWDVPHTGKDLFGVDLRCKRRLQPLGSVVWVKNLLGYSGCVTVCGAGLKLTCHWMESKGSYGR